MAAVTGDDVLAVLKAEPDRLLDNGLSVAQLGERLVSANAYMGVEGIVQALAAQADVVITGRVADPSLFLAPQVFEFGWAQDDWSRLGCAGQITGGYFADPGVKDVPDLAHLGFPLAEVNDQGEAIITKVAGSGGRVYRATCAEQLIYEVHDPAAYLTPDVTANFSQVSFADQGADRVQVQGATGQARPESLKVSVGYLDGWIGEGQMSYGGPGALARARLARDVVLERLRIIGVEMEEVRAELMGVDSLHGERLGHRVASEPWEVRLRVAARCAQRADAVRVGNEVETLYTNGPSGGGASGGGGGVFAVAARASGGPGASGGTAMSGLILRALAHSRTGDKGDTSNISVIAYRPEDYPRLCEWLTAERVAAWFAELRDPAAAPVRRYELPGVQALNFVLPGILRGGVTRSLALDAHGKSLGSALLDMPLDE